MIFFVLFPKSLLKITISANLIEVCEGPYTSDKQSLLIAIKFKAMSLSPFSSNYWDVVVDSRFMNNFSAEKGEIFMSDEQSVPKSWKISWINSIIVSNAISYLATITKWNFNWSLWGVSHLGQAKLLDCNQIQSHVAGNNWWWLLDMILHSKLLWNQNYWNNKLTLVPFPSDCPSPVSGSTLSHAMFSGTNSFDTQASSHYHSFSFSLLNSR